jgi:hypothetical protein
VDRIMTTLAFRFMLLKRAYTRKEFEGLVSTTKFRRVEIQQDLIGLELLLTA